MKNHFICLSRHFLIKSFLFAALVMGIGICGPLVGQEAILKLQERLYASQYLESLKGIKYDIRDSLRDDIHRMDLSSIPELLTFQLKFHDFTPKNEVTEQMIIEQLEVVNAAFNSIDMHHFIQNENLDAFYALAAVPSFKFCFDEEISRISIQNELKIDRNILDKLSALDVNNINDNQIHVYITELNDNYAGLATAPFINNQMHGIVIDYRFFGIQDASFHKYNGGKTLVHLLAHYLGLNEMWNELEPCGDDAVNDTPIHNYANFTVGSNFKNVSTCEGQPVEMIVNYMDNIQDEYLTMFTQGQVERLRKIAFSKFGRKNQINLSCQFESTIRSSDIEYKLYPNPNAGEFVLVPSRGLENVEINVLDLFGKEILKLTFSSISSNTGVNVDISDQPTGIYFVKISSKNEGSIVKKIVKK